MMKKIIPLLIVAVLFITGGIGFKVYKDKEEAEILCEQEAKAEMIRLEEEKRAEEARIRAEKFEVPPIIVDDKKEDEENTSTPASDTKSDSKDPTTSKNAPTDVKVEVKPTTPKPQEKPSNPDTNKTTDKVDEPEYTGSDSVRKRPDGQTFNPDKIEVSCSGESCVSGGDDWGTGEVIGH